MSELRAAPQEASELFMDCICDGGTYAADCTFCGRTWFNDDAEDYGELCEKAKANPEKYVESSSGIGIGYIDGKQYVYGCCKEKIAKYEEFIWRNRQLIARYFSKRAAMMLKAAKDAEELAGKVERAVLKA